MAVNRRNASLIGVVPTVWCVFRCGVFSTFVTASGIVAEHSQRLADAVDQRRRELGYTTWQALQDAAGISAQGLKNVRNGERRRYQDRLTVPLTRALRWTPDSIERLLAGDEPTELGPTSIDLLAESAGRHQMHIGSDALTRAKVDNDALAAVAASIEHLTPVIDGEVSRLERRIEQLERAVQSLGPVLRELRAHVQMDVDDELDAILAEVSADEAQPPSS